MTLLENLAKATELLNEFSVGYPSLKKFVKEVLKTCEIKKNLIELGCAYNDIYIKCFIDFKKRCSKLNIDDDTILKLWFKSNEILTNFNKQKR